MLAIAILRFHEQRTGRSWPGALGTVGLPGLTLQQTHQDHRHVVTPEATHLTVRRQTSGQQLFAHLINSIMLQITYFREQKVMTTDILKKIV